MKRQNYLLLAVAATMLVSTLATMDNGDSTFDLPDPITEAPLKSGETPNCTNLELDYQGYYKATQEEGDVLIPQQNPSAVTPSKQVETTTSKVVITTTNTTTTTYKIETTTTTTTVDATTTATNVTTPMKEPCVLPKVFDGKQYNWWQILLETGGKPGTLNGTEGPNAKNPPSGQSSPCRRPLYHDDYDAYIYNYKKTDFKTYYRDETSFARFRGTPKYFEDIRGELIWTPPERANDTRVYAMRYIYDDTGFWVFVERTSCFFVEATQSLYCAPDPICSCKTGELDCLHPAALPSNLLASLIG